MLQCFEKLGVLEHNRLHYWLSRMKREAVYERQEIYLAFERDT